MPLYPVSWADVIPAARYDLIPWETVIVEEAAAETGAWGQIDELTLSPVDVDPADPQARNLTTVLGTAPDLWYRLTFKDGDGGLSLPTTPVQNSETAIIDAEPYATVAELTRVLKLRTVSAEQTAALERVLSAAAGEINSEIERTNSDLSGWQLQLATEVNLERAVEHWEQGGAPFGIFNLGAAIGSTHTAKDSWERHANKLVPLKASWGIA